MSIDDLVVKHAGWIRTKARQYCVDETDADDLASDTIVRILSQAEKYNPKKSFKPWALTVMANIFKTQYNRKKCVMFTSLQEMNPSCDQSYADQLASVNRISEMIEKCQKVSEKCVESVMLYAEGFSYEEIAELKGIPVGTVRSRIAAGRKLLHIYLEV